MSELTQAKLKEFLHYDPETGIFTWKVRSSIMVRVRAGDIAGCKKTSLSGKTYVQICLDGRLYYAHRLAWLYMKGYFPDQIDHSDGNGVNNIFSNLSGVSDAENKKNVRLFSRNSSGIPGVKWYPKRGRWYTYIGRQYLLWTPDFFEACCARKSAEVRLGFHANHGTVRPL